MEEQEQELCQVRVFIAAMRLEHGSLPSKDAAVHPL
jgi:hypothetical protein